jgi:8-oxo-dGTP pyrophosphatase MutT (NUDIX family)
MGQQQLEEKLGGVLQRRILVNSNLIACGAVVYAKKTNRVLFLLRNTEKYNETWALAGGKVEKNETIFSALKRELLEEISLDVSLCKIVPLELFTSKDNKFSYHTFVCIVEEEFIPTLNDEHKGYCWCDINNYPKPLHPGLWSSWSNKEIKKKLRTLQSVLKIT